VAFELSVRSIKIYDDNSEYEELVSTLKVKLPTEKKQGKGF